jgi:hypothetical protein
MPIPEPETPLGAMIDWAGRVRIVRGKFRALTRSNRAQRIFNNLRAEIFCRCINPISLRADLQRFAEITRPSRFFLSLFDFYVTS